MQKHEDINFCNSLLRDERFKNGLQKYSGDSKNAICTLCNKKVIDIRNIGILSVLVSPKTKNKKREKEKDLNSSTLPFSKTLKRQSTNQWIRKQLKSLKVIAEDAEIDGL